MKKETKEVLEFIFALFLIVINTSVAVYFILSGAEYLEKNMFFGIFRGIIGICILMVTEIILSFLLTGKKTK